MSWPPPKYEIPEVDTTPLEVLEEIQSIFDTSEKSYFPRNLKRLVELLTTHEVNAFAARVKDDSIRPSAPTQSLFESLRRILHIHNIEKYNYWLHDINWMNFIWSGKLENENAEFENNPEHAPVRKVLTKAELLENQYKLCCMGYVYYYAVPEDKKQEALEKIRNNREFDELTEQELLACVNVEPTKYNTIMEKKVFRGKVNATLKNTYMPGELREHIASFMGGRRHTRKRKTRRRKIRGRK